MLIRVKKFVVQNNIYLLMEQLPAAVRKEWRSGALPTGVLGGKMFKLIR
jgi:hypothetical protein